MGKFVRIFIAIMVVLSFVVLAKYEAAGASNPGNGSDQTSHKPHDPAVDLLPSGSGSVVSDMLTLTLPSQKTNVKICFAAPPSDKKPKIFSSRTGSWVAIKTDVNKGTACADVPSSGKFILLAQ